MGGGAAGAGAGGAPGAGAPAAWRSEGAALRVNQQARERIGFQRIIVNTLLAFADRLAGGKLLPNALDRIRSGNINLAAGWSGFTAVTANTSATSTPINTIRIACPIHTGVTGTLIHRTA